MQGLQGPQGEKGDQGINYIRSAYLVTFNNGSSYNGIAVQSDDRLPIDRSELDVSNIVTLDTSEETIKFNQIGYYKISINITARKLPVSEDFDPDDDFITIGFRKINTDNIYIGASKWAYDEEYINLFAHGIVAIESTENLYELVNLSPQTIFLNTPDLRNIQSSSYFTNSLVSIVIEYLGTQI